MKTPIKNVKTAGTKPRYCDYCENTGIIHNPHFTELGENAIVPCPKCVLSKCMCGGEDPYYVFNGDRIAECFCRETRMKIMKINMNYNSSGIYKKFQWKRLNNFKTLNKQGEDAKNSAYEIVRNFPDVNKGLFLWGNPGTGKTLLASIILTELIIRHAVEGRFISISRNLFKTLQESFHEGSETFGDSGKIEKELAEVDILVVDDFGIQKDTEWKQETLYDLVDARYEAEKFTIFTSNNNPHKAFKDLSQGRILSRIKEMCRILEISGEDYRDKL
ncbi:MAG TPA: ATP-binding protein [Spirochaetota bacterium]|nr:ATP-binding protein [Spirochaetota bacterium]HPG50754.1 ATP-binding protein [Spirochaetota bacterium]HPN12601.1 ATP-binding protein [Spirochaetota bacterium]